MIARRGAEHRALPASEQAVVQGNALTYILAALQLFAKPTSESLPVLEQGFAALAALAMSAENQACCPHGGQHRRSGGH